MRRDGSWGKQARRRWDEDSEDGNALEQAHKVAREDVFAGLSARLVQELAAPPTVLGSSGDSDDISLLEVELFVDRSTVVVHRLDCKTSHLVSNHTTPSKAGNIP